MQDMGQEAMVFALDFDGVISDSILECLVTAHNALDRIPTGQDQRVDLSAFSDEEVSAFKAARVFIRRGEDYITILKAIREGIQFTTQAEFDAYQARDLEVIDQHREVFYGSRRTMQTQHSEEWLALNPVYNGLSHALRGLVKEDRLHIVTTKDPDSVSMILAAHGVELNDANIFQADRQLSKPTIINQLLDKLDIAPERLIFVDDHPGTVLEVFTETDVRVFAAEWGYNTPDQIDGLRARGVLSLKQKELIALILKAAIKPSS